MTDAPYYQKLELFSQACDLIGGREVAARALRISDRSLRYLLAGQRQLHTGLLEDMGRALIDHANLCRGLERQLNPGFAKNVAGVPPPHGNTNFVKRLHAGD